MMEHPEFFEGVRTRMIEKFKTPNWAHKNLGEVTTEDIDFFFNREENFDFSEY